MSNINRKINESTNFDETPNDKFYTNHFNISPIVTNGLTDWQVWRKQWADFFNFSCEKAKM
jgi:cytochrome oxidase assembly protein ShyY1